MCLCCFGFRVSDFGFGAVWYIETIVSRGPRITRWQATRPEWRRPMQLKKIVEPFGEVNVYPAAGGAMRVVATILMEPHKEGAQTGIALDGSGSMAKLYGVDDGSRVLSPIFGGPKKLHNDITPVAQQLCAYLARKIDAAGGTTCIYSAGGPGGGDVRVVG